MRFILIHLSICSLRKINFNFQQYVNEAILDSLSVYFNDLISVDGLDYTSRIFCEESSQVRSVNKMRELSVIGLGNQLFLLPQKGQNAKVLMTMK